MKHKDPWEGVLAPQENPNKQVLEWYDNFVDSYVMQYNNNVYNSACEYADLKNKKNERNKIKHTRRLLKEWINNKKR